MVNKKQFKEPGRTRSAWSSEMLRVLIQYIDSHKGCRYHEKNNLRKAIKEIRGELQEKVDEEFLNDMDEAAIRAKIRELPLCRRPSEQFRRQTQEMRWEKIWSDGVLAINFSQLPGILYEKELQAWREGRDVFGNESDSDEDTEFEEEDTVSNQVGNIAENLHRDEETIPHPTQAPENATDASHVSDLPIKEHVAHGRTRFKAAPDIKLFKDGMEDLSRRVSNIVQELTIATRRNTEEATPAWAVSQPMLYEPLKLLQGSKDWEAVLTEVGSPQSKQGLNSSVFLLATIGAAVTAWALTRDLSGNQGLLKYALEEYNNDVPAAMEEHVYAARIRYLDEHVVPKAEVHAEFLRDKLSQSVLQLMLVRGVDGVGAGLENSPAALTFGSYHRIVAPFREELWYREWEWEILKLFEVALQLRIDLEKAGGRYSFIFPQISPEVRGEAFADGQLKQLAVFPELRGAFKPAHGVKFGEEVIIAPAVGHMVKIRDLSGAEHPQEE